MSLLLLSGPDWPEVGHPYGKHDACGGLLRWVSIPTRGSDDTGAVECARCGVAVYAWANRYAVDVRNAEQLDLQSAEVPDEDEDVSPAWAPASLEAYRECREHPAYTEWKAQRHAARGSR